MPREAHIEGTMKKLSLVLLAALALSGSSRAGSEMPPVSAVYFTKSLAEFRVSH